MWQRLGAVALVVLMAGCGGDSTDTSDGGDGDHAAADDAVSTETTAATPADESGSPDEGGSGPSTATVTLDGQTYEFSTEGAVVAQCLTDLFGIFSAQLPMAGGGDGDVKIVALHPDTDPDVVGEVNAISVAVGDEDWVADEADMMFEMSDKLEVGMSQVDSVEVDGNTVRGTATFVRQLSVFSGDEVETATGTFEATCGEERTS